MTGSQDYDLALRIVERIEPRHIRHIPHILYHWRAAAGSAARSAGEKPLALEAAQRAVADHLRRRAIPADVAMAPLLFAILWIASLQSASSYRPKTEGAAVTVRQRHSRGTRYGNLELLIVDNRSAESATHADSSNASASDPRVRVVRYDAPFNFSLINNWAAEQTAGEVLLSSTMIPKSSVRTGCATWLRTPAGPRLARSGPS